MNRFQESRVGKTKKGAEIKIELFRPFILIQWDTWKKRKGRIYYLFSDIPALAEIWQRVTN